MEIVFNEKKTFESTNFSQVGPGMPGYAKNLARSTKGVFGDIRFTGR